MQTQNNNAAMQQATAYDVGLRTHFQKVYNTMAIGLVLTGAVAYLSTLSPALMQLIHGTPLKWVVAFAPLAFLFFGFTPNKVRRMSASALNTTFYVFSAVFGLSLSYILLAYTGESVARVFFITAGMFAGTSIFGYLTKRDLSGMGNLMIMGAIGLLIAMVVNIFLKSAMLHFAISGIGVIVYTGLIAWDTQNIKETFRAGYGREEASKLATMGALSLYINFIMLFQFLLQFLGNRN